MSRDYNATPLWGLSRKSAVAGNACNDRAWLTSECSPRYDNFGTKTTTKIFSSRYKMKSEVSSRTTEPLIHNWIYRTGRFLKLMKMLPFLKIKINVKRRSRTNKMNISMNLRRSYKRLPRIDVKRLERFWKGLWLSKHRYRWASKPLKKALLRRMTRQEKWSWVKLRKFMK